MNKERILKLRREVKDFLRNNETKFEFKVDCELKERVQFIYSIIFPGLLKYKYYLRHTVVRILQYMDYSPLKIIIYRLIGMKIGKGVYISPEVILDPHFPELITIDDHVIIGWGARLFTHEYSMGKYRIGRISIGEGALIGGYSTIRGGVTIGKMAEIPYSSLIYKDVPEHAKAQRMIIRQLRDSE